MKTMTIQGFYAPTINVGGRLKLFETKREGMRSPKLNLQEVLKKTGVKKVWNFFSAPVE